MGRDVDVLKGELLNQSPTTGAVTRIKSGIPGFDELVGGGLIKDRIYLLAGPAGAGKSVFSTQFLYNGITKYGENGVHVVLEEPPSQIRENAMAFDWDLKRLEDSQHLIILDAATARLGFSANEKYVVPRPFTLEGLLYEVQSCIHKVGAKRVVIDSLDAMETPEGYDAFRRVLQKLTLVLKSFGCTTIMITETIAERMAGRRTVEEFVADGMVMLYHVLEDDVLKELKSFPNVKEAYMVYGVYDIVAKVSADSMDRLKEIVTWKIRRLDKVRSTLTMIVIEGE